MTNIIKFRQKRAKKTMDPEKDSVYKAAFMAGIEALTIGEAYTVNIAIKRIEQMNKENPDAYKIEAYKKGAIMLQLAYEPRQEYQDKRPARLFNGLSLELWNRAKVLEFKQVAAITHAIEELAKESGENRGIYAIQI